MEKVQAYEEAFAKIQKATKITDIDALVQHFLQAEDTDFSLFNYVNDLSNEMDRIEEQIEHVRQEMKRYKAGRRNGDNVKDGDADADEGEEEKTSTALVPFGSTSDEVVVGSAALLAATTGNSIMSDRSSSKRDGGDGDHDHVEGDSSRECGSGSTGVIQTGAGSRADRARKQMLIDLENKLRHHQSISDKALEHITDSSQTLHTLKSGISQLFDTLGCSRLPGAELLGNVGVTEGNLMQHLAFIEQATNALVDTYRKQWNEENNHGAAAENNNNWDANTAIHANQQFQFQHSPQQQQQPPPSQHQSQPRPPSSHATQSTSRPGSQVGLAPTLSIRAPSASGPDDEDGTDGGNTDESGMKHQSGRDEDAGAGGSEEDDDEEDEQPIDPDELIRQQRQQSRQSARRQTATQEE